MTGVKQSGNVWITRPADQADELCRLTQALGLNAIRFPVIEISPAPYSAELDALFSHVNDYEYLIFVSRNAVTVGFQHYLSKERLPEQLNCIAIGKTTARALEALGISNVAHADAVADSETLLALPELQAKQVRHRHVLLVRGQGGRELLSTTLRERGATVDIAEVYLRRRPQYDKNVSDQLWQQSTPDAIIVTSNEGIRNLVDLTPDLYKQNLLTTPLVVMSKRNEAFARQQGFTAAIAVATETSDTGLVTALSELLETSLL